MSLDAVAHNIRHLVRHATPAGVMAVVKADAYGHGAIAVGRTALAHGASWLAVYSVGEGVILRQGGLDAHILVFGPFTRAEAEEVWNYRLTPTVSSLEAAARLQERSAGRELAYHLKLDTGLERAGIAPSEAIELVRAIAREFSSLHHQGTYTHFVSADEDDKTTTFKQIKLYRESIKRLEDAGFRSEITHASNSAALLDLPEARFTMVRPGIATYGYYPSAGTSREVALVPALQLVSEVARVHAVPTGAGVGYGHEFRAARPTKIALVPVGYGDGLPRTLGYGRGRVIVGSQFAPIVGRVSMDQITIDVTDIGGVKAGEPVVLIGGQGETEQNADDLGTQAGTISYDILTGLLPRVPRLYVERGTMVPAPSDCRQTDAQTETMHPTGRLT